MAVKKRRTKLQPLKNKPVSNRPKRLRQWSDVSMMKALDAVVKGKMGVNRAALEFNVPRTTLKDKIAGRVAHGCNMGPKPYLTYEEEQELVEFLMNCSKMGYGKTRQDVMKLVESYIVKKGITLEDNRGSKLSNGWWVRFLQRWPKLSLRKGDLFAVVHEEASSYDVFKSYFDLLEDVMMEHGLKGRPSQIYNCDESGMPLQHKVPKVISAKGCKKVRQVSSGNKTQITILGCASATGQVIPPEAKKAEAENKKSKGTTKKRPAKSSLASNSKRQKFVEDKTDDECEEVGLQRREISESECAACFG